MSAQKGLGRIVAAVAIAMVSFCLAGGAIFYHIARPTGLHRGGPVILAAAMAGLFGGGLVALVVLIGVLRWRNGRD